MKDEDHLEPRIRPRASDHGTKLPALASSRRRSSSSLVPLRHRPRVIELIPQLLEEFELLILGKAANGCDKLRARHDE